MNKITTALLAALVLTQLPSVFNQLRSYESGAHAEYACRRWDDKGKEAGVKRMCHPAKEGSVTGFEQAETWQGWKPVAVWRY